MIPKPLSPWVLLSELQTHITKCLPEISISLRQLQINMSKTLFIILLPKAVHTSFYHYSCYIISITKFCQLYLLNKFQIHPLFSITTDALLMWSTIFLLCYRKILLNGHLVHSQSNPLQSVRLANTQI